MTRIVVGIAPRGRGERLAAAANAAGAGGGTLLSGKGSAPNSVLQLLGLGVSSRELLVCAVPEERSAAVLEAMRESARGEKRFGIAFETDASRFFKFGAAPGDAPQSDTAMQNQETADELVCFIVNKGYAEDAMAAARTAGAGGGTVLPARGTAKPDDETFLGVPLVPEKEMLIAVVPSGRAEEVCAKVRALPCLSAPGSGVAFRIPVRSFSVLGS